MADEIEIIHVRHILFYLDLLQIDTTFPQQVANLIFLFFGRPLTDEVIQGSVLPHYILFGVVDDTLMPEELTVHIIHGNRLMDDFYLASIHIHNRGRCFN